jgi:hypothetical protein
MVIRKAQRSCCRAQASIASSLSGDNENVESAIRFGQSRVAGDTIEHDDAVGSELRCFEGCTFSGIKNLAHPIRTAGGVAEAQKRIAKNIAVRCSKGVTRATCDRKRTTDLAPVRIVQAQRAAAITIARQLH